MYTILIHNIRINKHLRDHVPVTIFSLNICRSNDKETCLDKTTIFYILIWIKMPICVAFDCPKRQQDMKGRTDAGSWVLAALDWNKQTRSKVTDQDFRRE